MKVETLLLTSFITRAARMHPATSQAFDVEIKAVSGFIKGAKDREYGRCKRRGKGHHARPPPLGLEDALNNLENRGDNDDWGNSLYSKA